MQGNLPRSRAGLPGRPKQGHMRMTALGGVAAAGVLVGGVVIQSTGPALLPFLLTEQGLPLPMGLASLGLLLAHGTRMARAHTQEALLPAKRGARVQ